MDQVQLRWQRLPSFQNLAAMLLRHLAGILNDCRTKVRFGVVEAINGTCAIVVVSRGFPENASTGVNRLAALSNAPG